MPMKGSMNSDLTNIYKQKILDPHPNSIFKYKFLLIMNSAKPQLKTIISSIFKQHSKTEVAIIH